MTIQKPKGDSYTIRIKVNTYNRLKLIMDKDFDETPSKVIDRLITSYYKKWKGFPPG
jgi:hypothetical protein